MPAVAVTGAGGFIGRRLIEHLLREGFAVRALARKRPVAADADNDRMTVVEGALGNDAAIAELIDGADAVVHLAGLIKARTRQAFFQVNEGGTRHLAAIAARAEPAPKLVLISSLAAREAHLSSYAASKRAAETALGELDAPLPWTVLRPPAVYGPGDRETLAFFKGVSRGVGIMLGGPEARFSMIHVDDLAAAIVHVLAPTIADHTVLEIDDGRPGGHSWRSMIVEAERAVGRKTLHLRIPRAVLATLGHLNAGLRLLPGYTPMLTPDKVRELTHPDWVADQRMVQSTTGWKPAVSADRGFPATVRWYRMQGWL